MRKYISYFVCGITAVVMAACTADSDVVNLPPTIETGDFKTNSRTVAELRGKVKSNGAHIESVGIAYADDPDMVVNAKHVEADVTPSDATMDFSVTLNDLAAGHSYFYRTYVNSGNTKYYGDYKMFTTPSMSAPTFDEFTINEEDIQQNAIVVKARVTDLGVESNSGLTLTNPSFKYKVVAAGTDESTITFSDTDTSWSTMTATYDSNTKELATTITSLASATTYAICAYATTAGYSTSNMVVVTTKETTVPDVSEVIIAETDISGLNLTLKSSVLKEGTSSVTERGFIYSTTSETPVYEGSSSIKADETFTANLTYLQNSRKYYIRAYAKNESGYGYSEVLEYTTPDVVKVPLVYTITVTDIKSDKATLVGFLETNGVNISVAGFEFNGEQMPVNNAQSGGSFSLTVTGLSPKTEYSFAAYCITEGGSLYKSTSKTFTTKDAPSDDDVTYPEIQ